MRSLHNYGVSVARLSEVRLPDAGQRELKVPGVDVVYNLYHSGVTDNSGRHGVAIALAPEAQAALLGWEPISPRLARVRLRGAIANISVVAVYAPTLNAADVDKEQFYHKLQTTVDGIPSNDILVVAGDWNARTGPATETVRRVLGRFALGRRCDNGERLVNFAASNRLVVMNTRFQHPQHQLVTWYSNDGRTTNQIDYILARSRWASSVLDARAYHGADTGGKCGSDHVLVRATLRIRLKVNRPTKRSTRVDVAKLKLDAGKNFQVEVQNRFAQLQPASNEPEQEWRELKSTIAAAARSHLSSTKRQNRDWITENTLALAERSRLARVTGAANFHELRRLTTRAIQADRNAYWCDFAEETERAAAVGDTCKLYQLEKKASRKSTGVSETICAENGSVITSREERLQRWREHFEDLLNHPPPVLAPVLPATDEEYDCSSDLPTVDEI